MTTMMTDEADRAMQLRARARRLTNPAMAKGKRSGVSRRERETTWRQVFLVVSLGILLAATGYVASGTPTTDGPDTPAVSFVVTRRAPVRTGGS